MHQVATDPSDVIIPNPKASRCGEGSIIDFDRKCLGEKLPIPGTPHHLIYSSQSTKTNKVGSRFSIPVMTGGELEESVADTLITIKIAGKFYEKRFTREQIKSDPGLAYDFEWDGKDVYGRPVSGDQEVEVVIYASKKLLSCSQKVLMELALTLSTFAEIVIDENIESFCNIARGISRTREVSRFQLTLNNFFTDRMGAWKINTHHVYDINSRVLHRGGRTDRKNKCPSIKINIWNTRLQIQIKFRF